MAGSYFIRPYLVQASRKDPFTTFNIFLKYDLEKSYSSHKLLIYVFSPTLVIVESLYIPIFGFIYLFISDL